MIETSTEYYPTTFSLTLESARVGNARCLVVTRAAVPDTDLVLRSLSFSLSLSLSLSPTHTPTHPPPFRSSPGAHHPPGNRPDGCFVRCENRECPCRAYLHHLLPPRQRRAPDLLQRPHPGYGVPRFLRHDRSTSALHHTNAIWVITTTATITTIITIAQAACALRTPSFTRPRWTAAFPRRSRRTRPRTRRRKRRSPCS